MSNALSPTPITQYEHDGILFPISVLSPAETARFRAAYEELAAHLGSVAPTVRWAHLHFRWAYDLATHPAVLDAVQALLGPDLLVWGTLILCKPPHSPSYVSWHQDGHYANLQEAPSLSAWIALSNSTAANGCLRVIPGSHTQKFAHHETYAEDNLLDRGQEIEVDIDVTHARDVLLTAGEMSLHHIDIVHSSNSNWSNTTRLGFIVRFVTPQLPRSAVPLLCARGRADWPHLTLLEQPPTDNLAVGLAAQTAFVRQRQAASSVPRPSASAQA